MLWLKKIQDDPISKASAFFSNQATINETNRYFQRLYGKYLSKLEISSVSPNHVVGNLHIIIKNEDGSEGTFPKRFNYYPGKKSDEAIKPLTKESIVLNLSDTTVPLEFGTPVEPVADAEGFRKATANLNLKIKSSPSIDVRG